MLLGTASQIKPWQSPQITNGSTFTSLFEICKKIGFGMRLQLLCRETEAEAWDAAHELVRDVTKARLASFVPTTQALWPTSVCSS